FLPSDFPTDLFASRREGRCEPFRPSRCLLGSRLCHDVYGSMLPKPEWKQRCVAGHNRHHISFSGSAWVLDFCDWYHCVVFCVARHASQRALWVRPAWFFPGVFPWFGSSVCGTALNSSQQYAHYRLFTL